MLRKSFYSMAFLCLSLSANLPADDHSDDQKDKEREKQEQKAPRVNQQEQKAPKVNQEEQRVPKQIQEERRAPQMIQQEHKAPKIQEVQKAPKLNREVREEKRHDIKPEIQPITKEKFDRKADSWTKKGQRERNEFRDFRNKRHVFDKDYWNNYYGRKNHWRFNNNFNWWAVSTPLVINDWLHYSSRAPRYYYYGDNGVVYYSDSSSYNNFIQVQQYNDFVNQAVVIANNIPQVDPQNAQWKPLGVFALSPESGPDVNPNDYFTLAVTSEGVIGGVYFNPDKNQNEEIEGVVDGQSLRAVWKFIGTQWPIFETGIFNFTQDESTAFIHYPNGRTEPQLLIRLQE